MSSIPSILSALESAPGHPSVLATLVKVVGSSYRRPGALLLVGSDGTMTGAISGGCLESDVQGHAERVLAADRPTVLHYDLARDDPVWGLGLGCKADLDVLLEPVAAGAAPAHLRFARDLMAARRYGVVATVFRSDGDAVALGARLLVADEVGGDVPAGPLREAMRHAAGEVLAGRTARVETHEGPWGVAEVLYDVVVPPIAVLACGGRDAVPLARLAAATGWPATIVTSDARHTGLDAAPAPDERTAAVVMTHNYERDQTLLAELLPSEAGYVGILGPRARTEQLVGDLRARGIAPTEAQLARLHGPVGLDIGAETPEEVAMAIVAEIQGFFAGRPGRPLRERRGAIHG